MNKTHFETIYKNIDHENLMLSRHFMEAMNLPKAVIAGGANAVLKVLQGYGLKPLETVPFGKGVSFFVDRKKAEEIINAKKIADAEKSDESSNELERQDSWKRDRSLARAILDLYIKLGETPNPQSNLIKMAQVKTNQYEV